jgi:transcriptional regulator with XRE-family HTH domain
MTFGERLCALRKEKGFTQEKLAKAIGVAKSTLTGYEKNNREPNMATITKLSKALAVSGNELLGLEPLNVPLQAIDNAEIYLLNCFRKINDEGKELVLKTTTMAVNTYPESHSSHPTQAPKAI